jgi:hypothetical protein
MSVFQRIYLHSQSDSKRELARSASALRTVRPQSCTASLCESAQYTGSSLSVPDLSLERTDASRPGRRAFRRRLGYSHCEFGTARLSGRNQSRVVGFSVTFAFECCPICHGANGIVILRTSNRGTVRDSYYPRTKCSRPKPGNGESWLLGRFLMDGEAL